MQNQFIQQPVQ